MKNTKLFLKGFYYIYQSFNIWLKLIIKNCLKKDHKEHYFYYYLVKHVFYLSLNGYK